VPCNTIATFQRDFEGRLDLTVFCRSNDIIWGAYGANAVHMSFLLEYMALWIRCPVGVYRQVSVNWHGYLKTIEPLQHLRHHLYVPDLMPYSDDTKCHYTPMAADGDIKRVCELIQILLEDADGIDPFGQGYGPEILEEPWAANVYTVLKAHHEYKVSCAADALDVLDDGDVTNDWNIAARQWLQRRVK
jgi:hypothetical protein